MSPAHVRPSRVQCVDHEQGPQHDHEQRHEQGHEQHSRDHCPDPDARLPADHQDCRPQPHQAHQHTGVKMDGVEMDGVEMDGVEMDGVNQAHQQPDPAGESTDQHTYPPSGEPSGDPSADSTPILRGRHAALWGMLAQREAQCEGSPLLKHDGLSLDFMDPPVELPAASSAADLGAGSAADLGAGMAPSAHATASLETSLETSLEMADGVNMESVRMADDVKTEMDGVKMDGVKMDGVKMDGVKMDGAATTSSGESSDESDAHAAAAATISDNLRRDDAAVRIACSVQRIYRERQARHRQPAAHQPAHAAHQPTSGTQGVPTSGTQGVALSVSQPAPLARRAGPAAHMSALEVKAPSAAPSAASSAAPTGARGSKVGGSKVGSARQGAMRRTAPTVLAAATAGKQGVVVGKREPGATVKRETRASEAATENHPPPQCTEPAAFHR